MATDPLTVTEQVTEYSLNAVPEWAAPNEWYVWEVKVAWRGPGDVWAVLHGGYCLGDDGKWDYEPSPSNREDEWKATHRFGLDEALRRAREAARTVTVNGWTPAAIIAKHEEGTEHES